MNCKICRSEIPEILLNPNAVSPAIQEHLNSCIDCQKELASFRNTFALLDTWKAPEPSAYFDQKLAVRLREEQGAPSAGWFESLRARLLFNTGRQFRPVLIGSMALALLLGGGTFAGVFNQPAHPQKAQISAAVDDLEILDNNDQALQEMDQLFQDEDQGSDSPIAPPRS